VIIKWLDFADHQVASFRRSRSGSIAPTINMRDGWPDVIKGVHARRDDQGQDGGNGAGSGNDKKERPAHLAARLKEKPVDIKPSMVKTD